MMSCQPLVVVPSETELLGTMRRITRRPKWHRKVDRRVPAEGRQAPQEPQSERIVIPKSRLRASYHYLVYVLIAIFGVFVDPFNWQEKAAQLSQDIAYEMLIGPLYPVDHRDRITVVLFTFNT